MTLTGNEAQEINNLTKSMLRRSVKKSPTDLIGKYLFVSPWQVRVLWKTPFWLQLDIWLKNQCSIMKSARQCSLFYIVFSLSLSFTTRKKLFLFIVRLFLMDKINFAFFFFYSFDSFFSTFLHFAFSFTFSFTFSSHFLHISLTYPSLIACLQLPLSHTVA